MDFSDKKFVYFAAANTPCGFVGYFDEIFAPDRLKKIYILKGGPGTGKSYLLAQLAQAAEKRGYEAEYFLCSSDTGSLDAILIPSLSLAVLDGTAPHQTDPVYPGAVEVILNLGDFFNIDALCENADDIKRLTAAKRGLYKKAYAYMRCAAVLREQYDVFSADAFLYAKASAFCDRLVASLPEGKGASDETRLTHAFGTSGEMRLYTFENNSKTVWRINDVCTSSYILLAELKKRMIDAGHRVITSYSPLDTSRVDGLYLPDASVCVTLSAPEGVRDGERVINMARFIEKTALAQHRKRLRFLYKSYRAVLDEALRYLSGVKVLHDEVEAVYSSSMDFARKEKFTEALITDIFR